MARTFVIAASLALAGDDAEPVLGGGGGRALDVAGAESLYAVGAAGGGLIGVKGLAAVDPDVGGVMVQSGGQGHGAERGGGEGELDEGGAHFEDGKEIYEGS